MARLALRWTVDGRDRIAPIPEVGTLTLGRDEECDVWFADPTMSRHHALVFGRAGRSYLRHLSATNPTYVNGAVVVGDIELRPGDELWLPVALVRIVEWDEDAPPG